MVKVGPWGMGVGVDYEFFEVEMKVEEVLVFLFLKMLAEEVLLLLLILGTRDMKELVFVSLGEMKVGEVLVWDTLDRMELVLLFVFVEEMKEEEVLVLDTLDRKVLVLDGGKVFQRICDQKNALQ